MAGVGGIEEIRVQHGVVTDAGERMARQERAAGTGTGGGTIDASTKVVIPQVTSLAVA